MNPTPFNLAVMFSPKYASRALSRKVNSTERSRFILLQIYRIAKDSKSATQKRENSDNPRELEPWQIQKRALKKKFPEGWNPRKRLHPDTLDTIRHLHQQDPATYSTPALAQEYKVSPEAIRRILKSKWRPSPEIAAERRELLRYDTIRYDTIRYDYYSNAVIYVLK
ncbi:predicted protein [Histoplasma mississippiense (nom. inval.)]|uniref:predicted protein n=1 Tax=Ajellomyces capsulatus (strain NAm1 / WU24) TaxID=2059318 RepID=UPI000157C3A3|nr:predicted protein [Histoplasma mississippiense (nom. inval.)]EDN07280.1 predicted protein [Histoplasma mississippiense (nom. inval.)]